MGLVTLTIDLETGMRVASKVGNLRSEFGLRVLQLFAMYATDGQTKPTLTAPFSTGGGRTFRLSSLTAVNQNPVFAARCYASAAYAIVRTDVCLSRS